MQLSTGNVNYPSKLDSDAMRLELSNFRQAARIGVGLSLPFVLLEIVFRIFIRPEARLAGNIGFLAGLVVLFGMLWTLPFVAATVAGRLVDETATESLLKPRTVAQVAVVMGLAFLWGALINDQLPCFMAVPNCD
jgi:uncharacterized PurR-regulated membrane protein YhhQ (DUF165 family)